MKTKIDIISGFLGAGKTTLINKILNQILPKEKIAIIENEFGEIGVDGQILEAHGVEIREIRSGCICCTLFGDFVLALNKLLTQIQLDRVIVEPTGLGRLSDILKACENVGKEKEIVLNMTVSVVDCLTYEMYSQMFGDFFRDQIQFAKTIFLSRTQLYRDKSVATVVDTIHQLNNEAKIISTPWDQLTGADIINYGQNNKGIIAGKIKCDDDFNHNHSADDNFQSWSTNTLKRYSHKNFHAILDQLQNETIYGTIFRGKGIFKTPDGSWLQFNYVPGEIHFKKMDNQGESKIVIIGKGIKITALNVLFDL